MNEQQNKIIPSIKTSEMPIELLKLIYHELQKLNANMINFNTYNENNKTLKD